LPTMLCEVNLFGESLFGHFFGSWIVLNLLGLFLVFTMSGYLFIKYYVRSSYETWRFKTNPRYPSPEMVRSEILQMCKGITTATVCPALSIVMSQRGIGKAYCGVGEYGVPYLVASFFVIWIASDFWEFYYHRIGHTTQFGWNQHKYHHVFYNPSPFAVIADEYVDQFVRSMPLLLFPMIAPINMDLMFFQFGAFFYGFGVYLHWGFELDYPDAHHPWINTAFQHYCHHAKSINNKPYHTGFFFKLWDQLFKSEYDGDCFCVKCSNKKGERTREKYSEIKKFDYSVMLNPSFWLAEFKKDSTQEVTQQLQKLTQLAFVDNKAS